MYLQMYLQINPMSVIAVTHAVRAGKESET